MFPAFLLNAGQRGDHLSGFAAVGSSLPLPFGFGVVGHQQKCDEDDFLFVRAALPERVVQQAAVEFDPAVRLFVHWRLPS